MRHNDVTDDQKYSLTESRLETEINIHNLEKSEPGKIFLFLFQAMKGNFLTFACWKVITRRERPKSAPYLRLKNIQGTTIVKIWKKKFFKKIIFEIFFEKKVFFKSQNAEKLKKRPFRLIQCFLQTENFKKNARGYPLINFKNFRKKSHSAEKNPKGGPFGLTCTFGSIKKFMV